VSAVSPTTRRDHLVSWSIGAAAVAIADGCQAACVAGDASPGQRLELWVVASTAVALPAMAVAILCAFALDTRVFRNISRQLAGALGWVGEGRGVVVVAAVGLLGATLTHVVILGRTLSDRLGPHMAPTATVIATAVACAAWAMACAASAPYLRRLPRLARQIWAPLGTSAFRGAAFVTAMSFALGISIYGLLPQGFAITPTAGACALTALYGTSLSVYLGRKLAGAGGLLALGVALASCGPSPWMFRHLSSEAKLAIVDHAPLAGVLLLATQPKVRAVRPVDCPDDGSPDTNVDTGSVSSESEEEAALPPADASRPNLVLIHFDALRPDHLGFEGYGRKTSPVLDRLRESATLFQNAYTPAPGTRYAMASAFTGVALDRIPQHRGVGYELDLLPAAMTLAERLEGAGYDRVGFTLSAVIEHSHGIGQGFRVWETPWPLALSVQEVSETSATRTTDAATRYLQAHSPGRPFLLFAHYQCTHEPYVKHAEWDFGDADVDLYDSALAYCDREIGRLLAAVDARPDAEKTAVILYSDHGELFGEHGFHEHGNSLFEPDVRVVMLVRPPAALRTPSTPRTVTVPVSLVDLTPTLLDFAREPWVAGDGGHSLVSLLERPADPELAARPIFLFADLMRTGLRYDARGVVKNGFKYIRYESAAVEQLFDLQEDPHESQNIAASRPAIRARLARLVDENEADRRPPSELVRADHE
jgi:arylsulfatase A-like enzyme